MIILRIDKNDQIGFQYHIELDYDNPANPEINKMAEWVSNTFKHNFVLLEKYSRIKAGGCTNNALGWKKKWGKAEKPYPTGLYQLRCHEQDAAFFLLKYQGE